MKAFAVSYWNTLVDFFVKSAAWKTVASSNTLFSTALWLTMSACLSIALSTFLVHLASSASHGAWSACSPVCHHLSGEGAFACVRGESCALCVRCAVVTAPGSTHVLLAHLNEVLGVNDGVATVEWTSFKSSAMLLGEVKSLAVL
jgi:hypothetical protein